MIVRICLMIFCLMIWGCSIAPLWKGTVTLELPLAVDPVAALRTKVFEGRE